MPSGNGHILVMGNGRKVLDLKIYMILIFFLLMAIYLGNGHSLVTAMLGIPFLFFDQNNIKFDRNNWAAVDTNVYSVLVNKSNSIGSYSSNKLDELTILFSAFALL